MVKVSMDIRAKAVLLYDEGVKSAKEICCMYDISERTLRRWRSLYAFGGLEGLKPKKPGPRKARHAIPVSLE